MRTTPGPPRSSSPASRPPPVPRARRTAARAAPPAVLLLTALAAAVPAVLLGPSSGRASAGPGPGGVAAPAPAREPAPDPVPDPVPVPAPAPAPAPVPGDERAWPLPGRPMVVRGWEPPAGPYGRGHRGVDLAAPPGAGVRAAATGRVTFSGRVAGRGVLTIEVAGSGEPPLRTTYEPVRALVARGEEVIAGQAVAVLEQGPFHCRTGCLHWGLRRGDVYLDPLSLLPPPALRRGPSRLLPVFGVPHPDGPRPAR
ncbi:M23 family metallopeptidase [Streptomyces sp. NBC_00654]|uniref:M23 family metallopeptidase n=1 Tax=Streptomyces sp. NBC_00654 TaxID=2975799 RepID=UPI002256FD18|nr:M23 family metallopeptidase [Streptomyces sp. NBC_00654]MCX4965130.1 M23 family metallopeptidase [Streptomyces sp. NBC_00654]